MRKGGREEGRKGGMEEWRKGGWFDHVTNARYTDN